MRNASRWLIVCAVLALVAAACGEEAAEPSGGGEPPVVYDAIGQGEGQLKLIAVGGKQRIRLLPEVPTVAETVPGYEAVSWFGLFGPAGMPPDVVAKINGEVRALFADAEFQKTFLDRYLFQSIAGTPEELMTFVRSEEPKWRKIIQDANIKVQ